MEFHSKRHNVVFWDDDDLRNFLMKRINELFSLESQ